MGFITQNIYDVRDSVTKRGKNVTKLLKRKKKGLLEHPKKVNRKKGQIKQDKVVKATDK